VKRILKGYVNKYACWGFPGCRKFLYQERMLLDLGSHIAEGQALPVFLIISLIFNLPLKKYCAKACNLQINIRIDSRPLIP
jgi:hypothetical protein